MSEPVLDIRELSVDYRTPRGRLRALRHVDLQVPRQRIVGIVGESGCGKSTLISAIIRLLAANAEVTAGTIRFEGRDLLTLSEDAMRRLRGDRLSMIFQDPMTSLNPVLTIGRQMTDIQYRESTSPAEKRRRSAGMLARVDIPDPRQRLDSYPHELSGGMRQRVAIAMALQSEPALLIADEPTTALDATLEVQIIHRLKELQAAIGCSILFISHHLGVIAELCEEVYVMYAGEVVESGPIRAVFHHPRHPYTRALLECDPAKIARATRDLPTIPGELPDLVDLPAGCVFRSRCPHAFERCRHDIPRLQAIGATDQRAACHLLDSTA